MTAVMGPVVHTVENVLLIGNGNILKPKINVVHTGAYYPVVESYTELIERLIKDRARNQLIVDLISEEARAGRFCLVLTERVNHARELHRLFSEINQDTTSFVITGRDPKETRRQAIDAMNAGTGHVLFSTKLADEGLDIKRLDRLFLTCPVRAVGKVRQQIGRIQRTFPGKKDAVVYDFLDLNSLAKSQFYTRKQRIYTEYEMEKIDGTSARDEKAA